MVRDSGLFDTDRPPNITLLAFGIAILGICFNMGCQFKLPHLVTFVVAETVPNNGVFNKSSKVFTEGAQISAKSSTTINRNSLCQFNKLPSGSAILYCDAPQ